MNTSNHTGRTHRTLYSAFGPYTSPDVAPMADKPSKVERIADVLFSVALGLIGCVILYTLWVR